jgi:mycothiol synthase
MPPTPEPARTQELPAAFRLLFQHLSPSDRQGRIDNALALVERGELDPAGLFVLRGRGGLMGAVLALALPGACGLVWPPQCAPNGNRAALEDALLQRAADWLRSRNVKVAQALLSPEESTRADALPRNGFAHVTHLWFLRHDLAPIPQLLNPPFSLEYRSYAPSDASLFHQTLQRTYENTLDCPELNNARSVEEVVAGHRGPERFNPELWRLALADGDPVGVLLLADWHETGDWETSYVGVVPEARRRGFGRELMHKALAEARAAAAFYLTLSVDARNRPAWDLYQSLGFEPFDRREVFLAVWK